MKRMKFAPEESEPERTTVRFDVHNHLFYVADAWGEERHPSRGRWVAALLGSPDNFDRRFVKGDYRGAIISDDMPPVGSAIEIANDVLGDTILPGQKRAAVKTRRRLYGVVASRGGKSVVVDLCTGLVEAIEWATRTTANLSASVVSRRMFANSLNGKLKNLGPMGAFPYSPDGCVADTVAVLNEKFPGAQPAAQKKVILATPKPLLEPVPEVGQKGESELIEWVVPRILGI